MSSKAMSLKGKIKNYAKNNKITAQVVLQNYMFERFLERLSISEYSDKFIVKGGMLIAAIVGLDTRSTMDLDTTIRNLPLTEEKVLNAINAICSIELKDDVIFTVQSIAPIRKDDVYGGYCIRIDAFYDTIITPLSIDVSTGDIITPYPVKYDLEGIFDDNVSISLWGYNIETILAEKVETIISRGVFTTRPRDYYDVYIIGTTQSYNKEIFKKALHATAVHRGSLDIMSNAKEIIESISTSEELRKMWVKYTNKFTYANNISFESVLEVLVKMVI